MNNDCVAMAAIITSMVIIIIMMISTHCHNGKSSKIWRMIGVSVRRIVWHVYR